MKNILLGLFALVAVSACNNSNTKNEVATDSTATAVDPATAPVIKFEKDVYEFGKINKEKKFLTISNL